MKNYITTELEEFHASVISDIKTRQISGEDGGTQEEIFTQYATDLLQENGETEDVYPAYYEKALGTRNQHKINAYSISADYETLDLFITVFKGSTEISSLSMREVSTAAIRAANFFDLYMRGNSINEMEESSPAFQFALTLATGSELREKLVRVNVNILTDGIYNSKIPEKAEVAGYPVYFRLFDLSSLYPISTDTFMSVNVNFREKEADIPCIITSCSEDYQTCIAIIPGRCLADLYEKYGSRLLTQNIRSFLQFSGKINKGIRKTIRQTPDMFLAYNNGIAATAAEVSIEKDTTSDKLLLTEIRDLQIVNGGQTTAAIYHTWKKDKADISGIWVQMKISIIRNREKAAAIVSKISEYANTQNKVSASDLSSNSPFHTELEKVSRLLLAPATETSAIRTCWFYERTRGQYRNAKIREGNTASRRKAFDHRNPRSQVFTKEQLAKYINAWQQVWEEDNTPGAPYPDKILIGPHKVVQGNQKNYQWFREYQTSLIPDRQYFQDTIAKTILFRRAEKIYGVKPHSIGELRYLTVPYTISLLNLLTENRISLAEIWKNQEISENLQALLYQMMKKVEEFICTNAPGSLYAEWAKKEECWRAVREHDFGFDLSSIEADLIREEAGL